MTDNKSTLRLLKDYSDPELVVEAKLDVAKSNQDFILDLSKIRLYVCKSRISWVFLIYFKVPDSLEIVALNLKKLILKQNNLANLPSVIGKLHNLVEVNVSQNQLEYVSKEIGLCKHLEVQEISLKFQTNDL